MEQMGKKQESISEWIFGSLVVTALYFGGQWVWEGHAWDWFVDKVGDVSGAVRGEK